MLRRDTVVTSATNVQARADSYAFTALGQELPAVYANAGYRNGYYYDGLAPWTDAAPNVATAAVSFTTGAGVRACTRGIWSAVDGLLLAFFSLLIVCTGRGVRRALGGARERLRMGPWVLL